MKFFLCQNQPMLALTESKPSHYSRHATFFVGATPNTNAEEEEAEFWKELDRLNPEVVDAAANLVGDRSQSYLQCELFPNHGKVGFRVKAGPVTTALKEIFGGNGRIRVKITNFRMTTNELSFSVKNAETCDMKPQDNLSYAFQDPDLFNSSAFVLQLEIDYLHFQSNYGSTLGGSVTVTVSTEECSAVPTADNVEVYKKILQEGIGSDVVIIPANGTEVKAHHSMLGGHSAVLRAMFESDMQEARTHRVEMPDVSEASVRALLGFLYHWEKTEPNSNPMVAFEMLHAGHKYDIPVLESEMKTLLLDKPTKWLEVDVAMKLFLFAKNLPEDGDRLKKKAVEVLKRKAATLTESPTYVALFKEDPEAAMELCAYGFGD